MATGNELIVSKAPNTGSPCVNLCSSRAMLRPGQYVVQDIDKMEAITQPLYSYQLYPAAGAVQLSFFNVAATGALTLQDTNMQLPGQLPAPQRFLIEGIGIDWLSGLTAAAPVIFGAQAATGQANDMFAVLRQGVLSLDIGSKNYLRMSPLLSLPPRSALTADFGAADAGANAVVNQQLRMNLAHVNGPVFRVNPMLIDPGMNFQVNINFPGGAIAVPSTDALARIGVILYGTLYRPAQ